MSRSDETTEYEGETPSEHHDHHADSTAQHLPEPRSLPLIEDALDHFFEAYQEHYTDYDDCGAREAFKQDMEDRGVEFPDSDAGGFGNPNPRPGRHGQVAAGLGGAMCATSLAAIDHNCDLLDGRQDRRNGWQLSANALRPLALRVADTEDVGFRLERLSPDDSHRFAKAILEHFDDTDDGGSGNDAIAGLRNLLEKPNFLAWVLQALTLEEQSVLEAVAILGGGTGTALTILVDEFARMGLIGTGDVSVGFTLGMQLGRVQNDVAIGQFDDGPTRYTFHDAYAAAYRVGQRLNEGDADWALWSENIPLTYNWWALNNQPSYPQLQDFYHPLRQGADPERVATSVDRDPRFADTTHTERDRVKCLAEFPFRRLIRRDAGVQFWVGEEDYDRGDFRTDFHGYVWTPGFDAVQDYDSLGDRDIPGLYGIDGHRDALYAISHTAAAQLNSTVSLAEIQRANAVVHAPDMEVTANDLQLIEDAVADVLDLGYNADGQRAEPVRAVSLEGLGTDGFPGDYPLALAVYAGHDLPLLAHDTMSSPEYKAAVTTAGESP